MTLTAILQRSNQAAIESRWTQDEAIAWAKEKAAKAKKWPARRWRVEGPHGNTRLLGKTAAERARDKYGGMIVELIPTPTALGLPAMTVNQSRVEGLPACPICAAEVGFPCRTPAKDGKPGKSRAPHAERIEASKPPPPPLPVRAWVHDGKAPHTACLSLSVCNCTCRFCRKAWKDAGRPGGPRPARGPVAQGEHDEPSEPGLPPGGFA